MQFMKIINIKKRELLDLSLVLIITVAFTLFSLFIDLINRVYNYFYAFTSLPIAELLINAIFLWLTGLLWITYRSWKKAVKKQKELENIISSISPDVLMVIDRNRNISMCNASVKRMFGYEVEEVINQKTDLLYFDRRSKPSHKHEIHDTLERVGFHMGVAKGEKKNGDVIPLEIITAKLSGREGAVLLIRDESEKEKAVDSIKSAYLQVMQIFNTSIGGIRVIDTDFNVLLINDTFKTLTSINENEMAGKKCYEVFYGHLCHTPNCPMTKILEGEKRVEYDTQFQDKEGVEVPCIVTATPFLSSDGKPIGIVENFIDITERKKMGEEIKEAKDFLESVIESSRDGIVICDDKGFIISVNAAMEKMCSFSKEEMIGKHASSLTIEDKDVRKEIREKTFELFEKGFTSYESIYKNKDGKAINVECNTSMIKDEKGNYIRGVSIVRDITERKKIEQQLFQSEKLKSLGELAGGVAHDFNNVLAAIMGRVQLLEKHVDSPVNEQEMIKSLIAVKKGLKIIDKAARDGAETVRRIQEFSSKRADDKYFTKVDINDLLDCALEFTRIRWKNNAESKGINIVVQKKFHQLPPTTGNEAELREVFTNLINNAIDALPQGGHIEIKTFKENDYICVKIKDTGVGIPKTIQEKIFDPFFTTKGVQSTGLGLSISYGIVNRHRGTITVESVEGKGTTFTIKLPEVKRVVKENEKIKSANLQRKAKILVIEDEEEVRNVLYDILIDAGHEVEIAFDGIQGIEIFKEKEFDLVFTDLGMPVMSGWQVAEGVKGINRKVPVALITGWNVNLKESEMRKGGVDFIIRKPFEISQVHQLVQDGMILREKFKAARENG